MKRALTLIELLTALVILGGLTAAIVPWLQTTSHLYTDVAPQQSWLMTAERALDRIGHDLDTGDFYPLTREQNRESKDAKQPGQPPRLSVSDEGTTLSIETRMNPLALSHSDAHSRSFAIRHEYSLDTFDRTITCRDQDQRRPSSGTDRVLLRDVADWNCDIKPLSTDLQNDEDRSMRWMLTIEIRSEIGEKATRTYLVRE